MQRKRDLSEEAQLKHKLKDALDRQVFCVIVIVLPGINSSHFAGAREAVKDDGAQTAGGAGRQVLR